VAEAVAEFTKALEREQQQKRLVGGPDRADDSARRAERKPGMLEPSLPGPQRGGPESDVSGRDAPKKDPGYSRGR
jgi:hypothetical protein